MVLGPTVLHNRYNRWCCSPALPHGLCSALSPMGPTSHHLLWWVVLIFLKGRGLSFGLPFQWPGGPQWRDQKVLRLRRGLKAMRKKNRWSLHRVNLGFVEMCVFGGFSFHKFTGRWFFSLWKIMASYGRRDNLSVTSLWCLLNVWTTSVNGLQLSVIRKPSHWLYSQNQVGTPGWLSVG